MKRKNGFTLVELLAVIGILGILVTIASTAVVSILSKQKETLAAESEKKLKDAAIAYVQDRRIRLSSCPSNFDPTNPTNGTGCYTMVSVTDIINRGLFEDESESCDRNVEIMVYKEKRENYSENVAYAKEGICK